jgi:cytosine/uracil/thiamine/allantoin permease
VLENEFVSSITFSLKWCSWDIMICHGVEVARQSQNFAALLVVFMMHGGCLWFLFLFFCLPTPAQGTEILQSAIPPEQAVDRTFSDLSTLGGCQKGGR